MLVAIKSSPAGAGMETLPVVSHCTIGQMHDVLLLLYKDKRTQKAWGISLCKGKTVHVMETFKQVMSHVPESHSNFLYLFFWSNVISPIMVKHNDSSFQRSLFNVITESVYTLLVRNACNFCCE